MASVERGGSGGVPDQARTFAALLRLVLPAVRSHGTLPRLAAAPTDPYAHDDERAPLIPTTAPAPPPAPLPPAAPAPSAAQPSSTSSSRWWPFGRVGDAATAPAPSAGQASSTSSYRWWPLGRAGDAAPRENLQASDIELGLRSAFPYLPSPPATSSTPGCRSGHAREVLRNWIHQHRRVQANTGSAQQTLPPTVVSAGTAPGQGMKTDWMKRFKGLLLAYVFFVLPLVLLFFPRYSKNENQHILQSLIDNSEVGPEKVVVLVLFVIHVTVGLLGVLLAHIADGPKSTKAVGVLTLWIVLSVLAFVDYILVKTLPDEHSYQLMFAAHFLIMGAVICCLWFVFVWPSSCCKGDTRGGRSA